jgi:predicted PilT family ATPase
MKYRKHFSQLKQLSLACPHIIGSFHATEIFEALVRFSSLNGSRRYGEVSTIVDKFIHVQKGEIVNWYTLNTTLSSKLNGEFHCDGERPVTEIRDKNNSVVGWLFYFARDINIVKNNKYRPDENKKKEIIVTNHNS